MITNPNGGRAMTVDEARRYLATLAGQLRNHYIDQAREVERRNPKGATELRRLALEQDGIRRQYSGRPPITQAEVTRAAAESQRRKGHHQHYRGALVPSAVTAGAPEPPAQRGSQGKPSDPTSGPDRWQHLERVRAELIAEAEHQRGGDAT